MPSASNIDTGFQPSAQTMLCVGVLHSSGIVSGGRFALLHTALLLHHAVLTRHSLTLQLGAEFCCLQWGTAKFLLQEPAQHVLCCCGMSTLTLTHMCCWGIL
jgi:hypothetical protein